MFKALSLSLVLPLTFASADWDGKYHPIYDAYKTGKVPQETVCKKSDFLNLNQHKVYQPSSLIYHFDIYIQKVKAMIKDDNKATVTIEKMRKTGFSLTRHALRGYSGPQPFLKLAPEKLVDDIKRLDCTTIDLSQEGIDKKFEASVHRILKAETSNWWKELRNSDSGLDPRQLAFALYTADYQATYQEIFDRAWYKEAGDAIAVAPLYLVAKLQGFRNNAPRDNSSYGFLK